ncbi:MAG: ABC transporter permease [Gemmatimonadota bacterium]|nr:MAG: ABC transporter permease [Gemmatimonadota bacterium]
MSGPLFEWVRRWSRRLRLLLDHRSAWREMDEEMQFHLAMEIEELVRGGMDPAQARRQALIRFGGVAQLKEEGWDARGVRPLQDVGRDLRYAVRGLRRAPGFSLVVVLTLALGIGANTALFSVLRGVLFSPLPYPEAERIVTLWEHDLDYEWTHNALTAADLEDYRAQNHTFEAIGAFTGGQATLLGAGDPRRIGVQFVTPEVLEVTAVAPALGRAFMAEDAVPGAANVAVLSHGLWQRAFGGDPAALGRRLRLDRGDYTIVGVMPREYRWTVWGEPQVWLPLRLSQQQRADRTNHFILGVGRIRSGLGLEEASADLNAIAVQLEREYPEANKASRVTVESIKTSIVGDVDLTLWLIMGAAGFVLLIACANLANLFLSRGAARQGEMAVRTSLGASRTRLVRQLTTESMLLTLIGGVAGLGLARFGVNVFLALEPGDLPRTEAIGVDGAVLLFCLAVSLVTGAVFGLLPALLTSGTRFNTVLRDQAARLSQRSSARRVKNALAVLQMATAIVLLGGAGLLVRSFNRLQAVDPGFRTENVLLGDVILSGERYSDAVARSQFQAELVSRLERDPGVERAALVSAPPFSIAPQIWTWIVGREPVDEQPPTTSRVFASPGYFEVMGISLVSGRLFDERDREDAPLVVVINQEMARRHWPDQSPIGERFRLGLHDYPPMEIVGVVSDIRQYGMRYGAYPTAFMPVAQHPQWSFAVMLETQRDPMAAVPALRQAVSELDPRLAVDGIETLEAHVAANVASPRFLMFLASAFAAVALALAAAGIYGVIAYGVSLRTHEIGVRLALGARSGQVLRSVLMVGLRLAVIAVALGLPLAFVLARAMRGLLYGIEPADPTTFALISSVVLVVALVASYVPAARAARSDPLAALRVE